jgi:autotransporter passenger strand-loop-strand repeat protein
MNNQILSSGSAPLSGVTIGPDDILTVNDGASTSFITVSGGSEIVFGSAADTTVEALGQFTLSSGGSAYTVTVASAGDLFVTPGGGANDVGVQSGGVAVLQGNADGVTVSQGGRAFILVSAGLQQGSPAQYGGDASAVTVESGGVLVVSGGANVSGLTVAQGGVAISLPGAEIAGSVSGTLASTGIAVVDAMGSATLHGSAADNLALSSGAVEYVLSGGTDSNAALSSGAVQNILSGGVASGAVLGNAAQVIASGGSAVSTTLQNGAVQYVFSAGSASFTTVAGGFLLVNSGGSAGSVTVGSSGNVTVDGVVSAMTLDVGGAAFVDPDGTLSATAIASGGAAYDYGSAEASTITSGGYEIVEGDGVDTGAMVSGGGVLIGDSSATVQATTVEAGGIELLYAGAVANGVTVQAGGTLIALPGANVTGLDATIGASIVSSGIVMVSGAARVSVVSAMGAALSSGMAAYALSGGAISGVSLGNRASLEIESGASAQDITIQGGGTLVLDQGAAATDWIDFSGSGGTLVVVGSTGPDAVLDGFVNGGTILLNALTGSAVTATLVNGDTLAVNDGTITEDLLVDSGQFTSSTTLVAEATGSGAMVSVAPPPPRISGGGVAQPVDLPLYVVPYGNGYKIGIEASLNGGATYQMYEFDTGGTGFNASYSPATWSSYSIVSNTPAVSVYASGNTDTIETVSTDVILPTTTGGTIAVDNADVGLITASSNANTYTGQDWNTDLANTPATAPLETNFYGDFGVGLNSANGLSNILSQVGGGLANGFIITLGSYPYGTQGQIGTVQIGLTAADIASFPTLVAMQGQNTLDPNAYSGEPTYDKVLVDGALTLVNSGGSITPNTGFVFDTGAPTTEIHAGTTLTDAMLSPFVVGGTIAPDGDARIANGTSVSFSADAATNTASPWSLGYSAGRHSGYDEADVTSVNVIGEPGGYVNTGLNAFFGEQIMFDLADGVMGFQTVECFAAGTRIRAAGGEIDVARLGVGDLVETLEGALCPIVWAGRRHIDCRGHPDPASVLPVRVRAHAFGRGRPSRHLFLSPDHALFLENVLIPVKYLIDGQRVSQVARDRITYHHIELARHEVIWAEGLLAETYLDVGERRAFTSDRGALLYHSKAAPRVIDYVLQWEARGYAPLVTIGPEIERARQPLSTAMRRFAHSRGRAARPAN